MILDSSGLIKMKRNTQGQRILIFEQYFENNMSFEAAFRNFCTKYAWNSD